MADAELRAGADRAAGLNIHHREFRDHKEKSKPRTETIDKGALVSFGKGGEGRQF